jgi:hypothetical protein
MLLGLFIVSTISASIGYLVAAFAWNARIRRRRRAAQQRLLRDRQGQGQRQP